MHIVGGVWDILRGVRCVFVDVLGLGFGGYGWFELGGVQIVSLGVRIEV